MHEIDFEIDSRISEISVIYLNLFGFFKICACQDNLFVFESQQNNDDFSDSCENGFDIFLRSRSTLECYAQNKGFACNRENSLL